MGVSESLHSQNYRMKKEGYRSRAAYKLKQIDARFRVIRSGNMVVDLSAAHGGWLQMAQEISGGTIIGVDIQRSAASMTSSRSEATSQQRMPPIGSNN